MPFDIFCSRAPSFHSSASVWLSSSFITSSKEISSSFPPSLSPLIMVVHPHKLKVKDILRRRREYKKMDDDDTEGLELLLNLVSIPLDLLFLLLLSVVGSSGGVGGGCAKLMRFWLLSFLPVVVTHVVNPFHLNSPCSSHVFPCYIFLSWPKKRSLRLCLPHSSCPLASL